MLSSIAKFKCSWCGDTVSLRKYEFFQEQRVKKCIECNTGKYVPLEYKFITYDASLFKDNIINPKFDEIFSNIALNDEEKIDIILFTFLNLLKFIAFVPLCEFFLSKVNSRRIYNLLIEMQRPSLGHYISLLIELINLGGIEYTELSRNLLEIYKINSNFHSLSSESKAIILELVPKSSLNSLSNLFTYIIQFRNTRAHSKVSSQENERFLIVGTLIIINLLDNFINKKIETLNKETLTLIKYKDEFISSSPWIVFFNGEVFYYEKRKDKENIIYQSGLGNIEKNLILPNSFDEYLKIKKTLFFREDQFGITQRTFRERIEESWRVFIDDYFKDRDKASTLKRPDLEAEFKIGLKSRKSILILSNANENLVEDFLFPLLASLNKTENLILNIEKEEHAFSFEVISIILNSINIEENEWTKIALVRFLKESNLRIILIFNLYDKLTYDIFKIMSIINSVNDYLLFERIKIIFIIPQVNIYNINLKSIPDYKEIFYLDNFNKYPYLSFEGLSKDEIVQRLKIEAKRRRISVTNYIYDQDLDFLNGMQSLQQINFALYLAKNYSGNFDKKNIVKWMLGRKDIIEEIGKGTLNNREIMHKLIFLLVKNFNSFIPVFPLNAEESDYVQNLAEIGVLSKFISQDKEILYEFSNSELESEFLIESYLAVNSIEIGTNWLISSLAKGGNLKSLNQLIWYWIEILSIGQSEELFENLINGICNHRPDLLLGILFNQNRKDGKVLKILNIAKSTFTELNLVHILKKFWREAAYRNILIYDEVRIVKNLKLTILENSGQKVNLLLVRFEYFRSLRDFRKARFLLKKIAEFRTGRRAAMDLKLRTISVLLEEGKNAKVVEEAKFLILKEIRKENSLDYWIFEAYLFLSEGLERIGFLNVSLRRILFCKKYLMKDFLPDLAIRESLDYNLARLYLKFGRFQESEKLFIVLLSNRRKELGESHPSVSGCYGNLAIIERFKGNLQKSLFYTEKDMKSCIHYFGQNHLETYKSYVNYGIIQSMTGNLKESEKVFRKGILLFGKLKNLDSNMLARNYSMLANNLILQGKFQEARNFLFKAFAIQKLKKEVGKINILNSIGLAFENEGNISRSEVFYRRSLSFAKNLLGENHLEFANVLGNLAVILDKKGDFDKAISDSKKSIEIMENFLAPENRIILKQRLNLVEFTAHKKDFQEANLILNEIRQLMERNGILDRNLVSEVERIQKLFPLKV